MTDDIGRFLEGISYRGEDRATADPEATLDHYLNTADEVLRHLGSMDDMDEKLDAGFADEDALLARIRDENVQHPVNTYRNWLKDIDIWVQNHARTTIWKV